MGINLVGSPSYASTQGAGYIVGSCDYLLVLENNNGACGNYNASDTIFAVAYNNGATNNNGTYTSIGFSTNGSDGQHHRGFIKANRDVANTGAATAGRLTFGVRATDSSYAEVLHINSFQNVGIGTCTPTAKLHNTGTSQFDDSLNFATRGKLSWGGSPGRLILTSCGTYNLSLGTDNFVDRMTIEASTGNIGIGTSTPCTRLSVKCSTGGIKIDLLSITTTDGAGSQPTMRFDTIEANCNVLGRISVCDIVPYAGTMIFETSGCKGAGSTTTTEIMRLVGTTGNVGINCTTPTYKLHVNGTFYAAGSSQDYKQSICEYNTDSCMFMKLKPVTYQYKDEYTHLGKELKSETQIGLIAEDVAEVYPELAILVNEDDQKIVRNVDYEKLSIVLLSEVQKLRKELDELKTK